MFHTLPTTIITMDEQFVTPENFGMVDDCIYRFGRPNEYNFSFLKDLKLKTIVYLAPTKIPNDFQEFLEDNKIRIFHPASIQETKDPWSTLPHEVVTEVLKFIVNDRVSLQSIYFEMISFLYL